MMIVVMAHWCPHCNDEVPKLVEWGESGDVPDGLQVVGISTAAREDAPNFPPASWLADDMGWEWPVLADDEEQTAARAVGTTGYPFIMFVDADGNAHVPRLRRAADRGRPDARRRRPPPPPRPDPSGSEPVRAR